ncbi:hypothetical protein EV580_4759 [Mycobacterium sp. BK086]|uniref:hypothetical protein n=1 Tax=Mycobacterium sp. BK086 TaxID=2512165 RepID=UPI0010D8BE75|nr:hypothetical protein [Mycobacterium sp. BK086]TDO10470.1 hypothetical protein EV580_4759 [Mycobacterium sp. BK086]
MSTTLDAVLSIHAFADRQVLSQSTEILARRGIRGFRFSFFSGPAWLLIFLVLGGWYFKYRKTNPEKAKKIEQRLRGASSSVADRFKTGLGAGSGTNGVDGRPYGLGRVDPRTAQTASLDEFRAKRFNPPPNWPPMPPGWTPDAEWKPDPSWPPAPPGWQFWVA